MSGHQFDNGHVAILETFVQGFPDLHMELAHGTLLKLFEGLAVALFNQALHHSSHGDEVVLVRILSSLLSAQSLADVFQSSIINAERFEMLNTDFLL